MQLKNFILDVDGVMTTGQFFYSEDGKVFKVFGAHDADGLKLIKDKVNIQFITADERGFAITKKRIVTDMGYKLTLVPEHERRAFIFAHDPEQTAFMGDGYYDAKLFDQVAISICPHNARRECLMKADYITPSKSAEGAVMDACLYLLENHL